MVEVRLPKIDVNDEEAVVKKIYVSDMTFVKKGDILMDLETTKIVESVSSPADGYVKILVEEGKKYKYGKLLCLISENKAELESWIKMDQELSEKYNQEEKSFINATHINATRKAIEKAKELGVDISKIKKEGIIREKDVIRYYEEAILRSKSSSNLKPRKFKYDLERVIVIGAGNGAEVVVDILLEDKDKIVVGLVDDKVIDFNYYDIPIVYNNVMNFPKNFDKNYYDTVIISFGSNLRTMRIRHKVYLHYKQYGIKFTNAISKSAEIRRGVTLGEGNVIGSRVYIGTLTKIGNNNLISYGCLIGHHNIIGDSNLFGPGVILSGSVIIGNNCVIGAGVSFINRVSIGDNVVLPVGYNVMKDIPSNEVIKVVHKTKES